jgi:hypothetical protein
MTFEEADRQYQQLLGQWRAAQIDQQAFLRAVNNLQVQTADGVWWRVRSEDGSWLRWDGANWAVTVPPHRAPLEAPPPPISGVPSAEAQAPKKGRRWWLTCSVILLLSVCCLALVGGGGYLAVKAGSLSALQLSSQLTGVANVSIVNLDDHVLNARLNQLDVTDEEAVFGSQRLEPFDIGGFSSLAPGRYQIDFESDGNPLLTLSCTIVTENRDTYRFVAVPEGLAITRESHETQDPAELDAGTSSLCRQ